eukprot:7391342-Prymnesium_polylepis.2
MRAEGVSKGGSPEGGRASGTGRWFEGARCGAHPAAALERGEEAVPDRHGALLRRQLGVEALGHLRLDEARRDGRAQHAGVRAREQHRVAHHRRLGDAVRVHPVVGLRREVRLGDLVDLLPCDTAGVAEDRTHLRRRARHPPRADSGADVDDPPATLGHQRHECIAHALRSVQVGVDHLRDGHAVREPCAGVVDDRVKLLGSKLLRDCLRGLLHRIIRLHVHFDHFDLALARRRFSNDGRQRLGALLRAAARHVDERAVLARQLLAQSLSDARIATGHQDALHVCILLSCVSMLWALRVRLEDLFRTFT